MKNNYKTYLKQSLIVLSVFMLSIYSKLSNAQNTDVLYDYPVMTIIHNNNPDPGYLFLDVTNNRTQKPAHLIIMDNYGTPVYYKYLTGESSNFSLQDNGQLFYRGKEGKKKYYVMDSSFNVIDSVLPIGFRTDGHDAKILESGNFLVLAKDTRVMDLSEIVSGGDSAATVSMVVFQELDTDKNIVFEWNGWDHFEITDTYNSLTESSISVVHANAFNVDPDGNYLLCCRALNEITKINRQTGEIIWRLGGKNSDFTFADSTDIFSMPHDIMQLPNGNLTLFDNGNNHTPPNSRGVEYEIDTINWTAKLVWKFSDNPITNANAKGSTRRLPNGNSIIGYGNHSKPGVIEVHPDNSKAFQLNYEGTGYSYRAVKFPWETNKFETNTDTVNFGAYEYVDIPYILTISNNASSQVSLTSYTTHTNAFTIEESFPIIIAPHQEKQITVIYSPESVPTGYIHDILTINSDKDSTERIAQQVHLFGTQDDFVAPIANISHKDSVNVPIKTEIFIAFNEAVRFINNTDFNYLNVDDVIILKKEDETGDDVPFNAVLSSDKTTITIFPDNDLESNQQYYIGITDNIEDYSDNAVELVNGTFTTADVETPTIIFLPADNDVNVFLDINLLVTFNEPVRFIDNTEIDNSNVADLCSLSLNDSINESIAFIATINDDKTEITINPSENFTENKGYILTLNGNLEDLSDNAIDTISIAFTTGTELNINSDITSGFNIFPNPTNGVFTINTNEKISEIFIVNVLGKRIYQNKNITKETLNINISDQPNGIYVIQIITNDNNIFINKICKE